jgi:hypothetical protein
MSRVCKVSSVCNGSKCGLINVGPTTDYLTSILSISLVFPEWLIGKWSKLLSRQSELRIYLRFGILDSISGVSVNDFFPCNCRALFILAGYFHQNNLLCHKQATLYALERLLYAKEKLAAWTDSHFFLLDVLKSFNMIITFPRQVNSYIHIHYFNMIYHPCINQVHNI